jgi:hypothetical protein
VHSDIALVAAAIEAISPFTCRAGLRISSTSFPSYSAAACFGATTKGRLREHLGLLRPQNRFFAD